MRELRILAAGALALAGALGQPLAAAPVPQVHALTGGRIVVAPGEVIETGTVVIRDGVIAAAGAADAVAVPDDARVHELEGQTVYPGLIDPYSVADWPEPGDDSGAEAPQGGHANALVTPERDMSRHALDEARFKRLRGAGFTTAVVAPRQGIFRGTSALLNLGEGDLRDNLLRPVVFHNLALVSNDFTGGYPNSLMGAEALLRQTVLDARWYRRAQEAYAADPGQQRPAFDRALEALAPVVADRGARARVVAETDDVLGTLRWAHLFDALDLEGIVVGNGQEYRRLASVKAAGLPHILPLDFPEAPEVGGEDEDDLSVGLDALRHWDRAPGNPAALLDSGLTVAFTSHRLGDPKEIHGKLAAAIERGLAPEDALAALTTVPAAMLGIEERAGTVAAGKMANLVVVEGDLFVDSPKIRSVWIDGRELAIKETKPPTVEPAGTWELRIDAGQGGQMVVQMTLEGDAAEGLSGSIGTQAGTLPLASAEVSGSVVTIEFDSTPLGMPGMVVFTLDIDGDKAKGKGTAPPGPFTVTATRTSAPPEVSR